MPWTNQGGGGSGGGGGGGPWGGGQSPWGRGPQGPKVEDIIKTEREGIERRRADTAERAERGEIPEEGRRQLAEMAAQRESQLDQLPPDPGGRIGSRRDPL